MTTDAAPHPGPASKLASISSAPGVYLMRDAQGEVIYVGKARNLRKRLAAYFTSSGHADAKVGVLVRRIADVETIVTRTEKEALILESNLIKRHRPRYNVVLKDDKRYPSLRLDPTEAYPRFSIVRKVGEDDAQYFGPFASARAVRETLNILAKTFKLRHCRAGEFGRRTRPCLHCQMSGCLAPCCREVDPGLYREQVQEAVMFLKGRTPELMRKIRSQMQAASEDCEFEKAARLRDKLFALERTVEKQVAVTTDFSDRDVFAAAAADGAGVVVHFSVRGGFLGGARRFSFAETMATEEEMLEAVIRHAYAPSAFVPAEIIVSHPLEAGALLCEWLAEQGGHAVRLTHPRRGEKARLLEMALRNARDELQNLAAGHSADEALLARLQKRLGLGRLPRRIECFDNSTLMGAEPVAGMVVFVDARPAPGAYRRFVLHTTGIPDDYAAMAEVLTRRFAPKTPADPLPDLVLLDGGRGQLGVAAAALKDAGLAGAIDLVAIAKKDERRGEIRDKIFVPGRVNPVGFGREEDLRLFLQRVRDEAHRFAVDFHRRRRRSLTLRSVLDGIRGLGPGRKRQLLRHFGGIAAIRAATLAELSALPGIHPSIAAEIKRKLG
ncbi:MAG: excinuclease ABC subunit UvrC [Desulfobacterales bacterium]|jgi:excinuclease ABC subunit C|nr:excinuclease ABC subunit UvrC [Desulfobacterales bacterium]